MRIKVKDHVNSMIAGISLFLFLVTLLYLFNTRITSLVFLFFSFTVGSRKFAIWATALIFLPGTIIHEIAHFLATTILFVPTGRLSFIPQIEGREIKTGRLYLGKTDPFRFTLIGLAPIVAGVSSIYLIGKFFLSSSVPFYLLFVICYLLFSLSSTMFSSKKDLERLIIVGPIVFIFVLTLHLLGISFTFTANASRIISQFLQEMNYYLLIVSTINFLVMVCLTAIVRFFIRK